MNSLDFKSLRNISVQRCNEAFFPLKYKDGPWYGNAMAGECGEACNVVKKIDRDGLTKERLVDLAKELADIVIYADLLAARFDINLGDSICLKFNEVSDRVGSNIKLESSGLNYLEES